MLGLSSGASAVCGAAALGAFLLWELSGYHKRAAGRLRVAAGALAGLSLAALLVCALAW
jgi:hypothetical protein